MDPKPYRVMALRLRPKQFQDVIAQDHIVKTLQNAIRSERVAHAYLFSGPRGTGKTTTARLLAKALNCENGPTPHPCASCEAIAEGKECASCEAIAGGKSMDVLEIDGASNRGIDEIRQLREEVGFAASKGKRRIYIIDEVHMLTPEAFNALLKTLEQPPPHVVFIFATTEPTRVPETILSRCQRYNFRRIPTGEILAQLQEIVAREGLEAEEEALFLIARKADGAMRDALSLLDQVVSFSEKEDITGASVRDLLGIISRDLYFELTQAILEADGAAALNVVARLVEEGGDVGDFTEGLLEHQRHLLVACVEGELKEELPEADQTRYGELAGQFQEEDLLRMLHTVSELELQMGRVSEPRFWLELTVMKLVKATSTVALEALMARLERLEGALRRGEVENRPRIPAPRSRQVQAPERPEVDRKEPASRPQQAQGVPRPDVDWKEQVPLAQQAPVIPPPEADRKEPAPSASRAESARVEGPEGEVTLEALRAGWDALVQEVKARKISVGTFLAEGRPKVLEGRQVTVAFQRNREFHANQVRRNREMVEGVAAEVFGAPLRMACEVDYGSDSEADRGEPDPAEVDDRVQMVLQIFDGKVVR